jgi:hypothetical protein
MVLAVGGDEEIVVAIVVVVADSDAKSVHGDGEAGLLCDVSEGAVVVVAVERGRGDAAGMAWPPGTVDEEDVLPAVVVVVDEGDAGTEGFRKILFAESAVVVDEMDAGGSGDIDEMDVFDDFWSRIGSSGGENRKPGESNSSCGKERGAGQLQRFPPATCAACGGANFPGTCGGVNFAEVFRAEGSGMRLGSGLLLALATESGTDSCSWMGWRSRLSSGCFSR